MRRLLFLLLTVALLGAACAAPDSDSDATDPDPASAEDRIISNVWRTDDPRVLEIGWFATSCERFDSLEIVAETTTRVDLLLRAYVDPDACSEPGTVTTTITLSSELGDRQVYDANNFIRDTVFVEDPRQG